MEETACDVLIPIVYVNLTFLLDLSIMKNMLCLNNFLFFIGRYIK